MGNQNNHRLQDFVSLQWYDEAIKFVFNFVAKTSELLLAIGIILSTANFLTDGYVMGHNVVFSQAWAWIQAIAIDSSLGIVFADAFQAVRQRDRLKAFIFFTLTGLLALVAGLVTHFDALSHASGLPVTDKGVSGIIPLWVMTTLRSVAVIGFLLASRLKDVSLAQFRNDWHQSPQLLHELSRVRVAEEHIDYHSLANALVAALQQAGTTELAQVVEQEQRSLPSTKQETPEEKLARAYNMLREERSKEPNPKTIMDPEICTMDEVRVRYTRA